MLNSLCAVLRACAAYGVDEQLGWSEENKTANLQLAVQQSIVSGLKEGAR